MTLSITFKNAAIRTARKAGVVALRAFNLLARDTASRAMRDETSDWGLLRIMRRYDQEIQGLAAATAIRRVVKNPKLAVAILTGDFPETIKQRVVNRLYMERDLKPSNRLVFPNFTTDEAFLAKLSKTSHMFAFFFRLAACTPEEVGHSFNYWLNASASSPSSGNGQLGKRKVIVVNNNLAINISYETSANADPDSGEIQMDIKVHSVRVGATIFFLA